MTNLENLEQVRPNLTEEQKDRFVNLIDEQLASFERIQSKASNSAPERTSLADFERMTMPNNVG